MTHRLCELARSIKIDDDDGLDLSAEGQIGHDTRATEQHCSRRQVAVLIDQIIDLPIKNSITPERTAGNFLGSFIASVIGMT